MIVEERDYHVYTGKLGEVVRMYTEEGTAIQQEHLGNLVGAYTVTGGLQAVEIVIDTVRAPGRTSRPHTA